MGKLCLPPGPPAGMMVSTNFPRAAVWVFLWIPRAERALRGTAAHSHVKLATGPVKLAKTTATASQRYTTSPHFT